MKFSKSAMRDCIDKIDRDYKEFIGHLFVRECIDLYQENLLSSVSSYDKTAIEFLKQDNFDFILQKVSDIQVNLDVLTEFSTEMLNRFGD